MIEQRGPTRLDSWKSIASYLKRDVRTVIRWEQSRGLPVRRLPGEARSTVYAYTSEIDAWLGGQQEQPGAVDGEQARASVPRLGVWTSLRGGPLFAAIGAAAAVLLVAALGYRYRQAHAAQPATATFTADSVQAWDDHHNLLWEYHFSEPFTRATVDGISPVDGRRLDPDDLNRASIQDLFGDGRKEVLAITHYPRSESQADDPRQVLSCFSPTGRLLWSYEPQDVLTFGPRTYRAPWELVDLIVSDEPGRKTIWLSVEAYTWGKSFIARLDADGHATMQYVQSGQIGTFQRLHGPLGPMLWIGGFNDEYDTASLAVMRDTQAFAVSPQSPGSRYACIGCATGDALVYFVFPRYEMSRILHNPNNRVYAITSDATGVEVKQMELSIEDQLLYDFSNDNDPRPLRVNYSASFWPNHLELEREGKVNHALADCPDRLHPPPVRIYRNGAWQSVAIHSIYSN
jgi:hypothetical protein